MAGAQTIGHKAQLAIPMYLTHFFLKDLIAFSVNK
jgi:hypothetical protein